MSHKLAASATSNNTVHAECPLILSSLLLKQSLTLFRSKILSFPPNSTCGPWTESSRIFAECFNERPDGHAFKESVEDFAIDLESFMNKFAVVFHRMITERNPTGHPALSSLGLPDSTIVNGTGVGDNGTGGGSGGGGANFGGGRPPNSDGGRPPNRSLRAEEV
jgi:hypothetical protein